MYDRLKETINEYEVIICRWPEYANRLEQVGVHNGTFIPLPYEKLFQDLKWCSFSSNRQVQILRRQFLNPWKGNTLMFYPH